MTTTTTKTPIRQVLDDLAHRLHLVPGGRLVPTTWLCESRQRHDAATTTPPRNWEQDCPSCGTRQHMDALWCYWCTAQLREVEDWNPTPEEWFAAVGAHVTRLAREDPNVAAAVRDLAEIQGQPEVADQIIGATR